MKKCLFALLFLISTFTVLAQANVTSSAISVQGIARNDQSNAVANSTIAVTAELYYFNSTAPTTPVSILTRSGNVTTDAFGLFAYVVDISSSDFVRISNSEAWIKISSGGVTFAQEKLMTVPYAIHAQNGVPTGAIMPYAGTVAPAGWILADGRAIPAGDQYAALKAIFSTNVPDLRGMFLRGAGTNTNTVYAGPALKATQADELKSHLHASGTLVNSTNGIHQHSRTTNDQASGDGDGAIAWNNMDGNDAPNNQTVWVDPAGAHTHTISGNTAVTGGTETRPVNYGINYIIKI